MCHNEKLLPRLPGARWRQQHSLPSLYCWSESEQPQAGDFSIGCRLPLRWPQEPLGCRLGAMALSKPCQHLLQRAGGSAPGALPKPTFQLRKAATSCISSGNETRCRVKNSLQPPHPLHHYSLISKQCLFVVFLCFSSFAPLRLLNCNVTQPPPAPASGRLTVTQMCHTKGEAGLATLGNAFAYF